MTARLPRQVKLFGAVSLLNDFASEMIYPLLPAFMTGVLGAGPQALGALDGAAEFAAAFVKLGAGRLADRVPRRGPLIVIGYFIAVVVRPVIAVTGAAWQVIGLRVVDRLGKGLRTPPRDALIADITPVGLSGRAFGLQRGMDHAGAVLGPILAWWLLASGAAGLRAVIGASIAPGVLVLVLAMWAVKDGGGRWRMVEERGGNLHQPPPTSTNLHQPARVSPLLAISFFYLLRMPDTLIILRSQQLGVPVAVVPLLWAAVHVVRSSSSFLGGSATDRLGPTRTMWAGWLVYAALAAGMARAGTAAAAWGLFLGMGLVAGLTESPERALVARLAGPRQGSGFGMYHGVTGFAALVGGLALGAVFQAYGAGPAFLASAVGGIALVVVWPLVQRRVAA
ncbi:MAG: MFS transporter [Gemmatimonadetes bacterium]|nr:MAG: MFS transporter [Gemmatimonadota bacterium]TLY52746.1 MAG: MFS transporter [Gemmatimonadota bacterium]